MGSLNMSSEEISKEISKENSEVEHHGEVGNHHEVIDPELEMDEVEKFIQKLSETHFEDANIDFYMNA